MAKQYKFGVMDAPNMDDQEVDERRVKLASQSQSSTYQPPQMQVADEGQNKQPGQLGQTPVGTAQGDVRQAPPPSSMSDSAMRSAMSLPPGAFQAGTSLGPLESLGQESPVEEESPLDSMSNEWRDMWNQLRGESRELMQDEMGYNRALAAEIGGRMSSSIGGGYAGAQNQAELDNLNRLKRHELDWGSMGLDFQNRYIDRAMNELARQDSLGRADKAFMADLFNMYTDLEVDLPFDQFAELMSDPTKGQEFLKESEAAKARKLAAGKEIQDELGFDPENLSASANAAYEAYLDDPSEENRAALEEAVGESKEDSELKKKVGSFRKKFLAAMEAGGVDDINNTSDTEAKIINQMLKDAKTPEQFEAAKERAEAWMKVKELREVYNKTKMGEEQWEDAKAEYFAKYGS